MSPARGPAGETDDSATGLPVIRTWTGVYRLVLVLFALYIVLLLALERLFA